MSAPAPRALIVLGRLAVGDGDALSVDALVAAGAGDAKQVHSACRVLAGRALAEKTAPATYRITPAGRSLLAAGRAVNSGPRGPLGAVRQWRASFRGRIWAALRMQRSGSLDSLVRLAVEGGERDPRGGALKYVSALEAAGYLQRLRAAPGSAPTSNGYVRWLLVRDSGPRPPVVRAAAREVWDPNTDTRYPLEAAHAE